MRQYFQVRRQQREALVDDAMFAAEMPNLAVPAGNGEAAVLYKRRPFRLRPNHVLQVV